MGTGAGVRGHCHRGEALMKYRNQGPAGVSGGSVAGVWCGHCRRGEGALSQG